MNNTPNKKLHASENIKSPNKFTLRKVTPHKITPRKITPHKITATVGTKKLSPSNNMINNMKLRHLRNIRGILSSQKSELEKNSFIDKVNVFQIWLDEITKKITQENTVVKKEISLLPLPDTKAKANCLVEKKIIEQIEQLQAEIFFLSSEQLPEEINKVYDFLDEAKNELQELIESADKKNNILVDLKREQKKLLQENEDRIKEACKNPYKKSEDLVPVDQNAKRPVLLFNISDLQKARNGGEKKLDVVKCVTPQKKPTQKALIAANGTKLAVLNHYNGNPRLNIPADTKLKSEIDALLKGKNIHDALEDSILSVSIFELFKSYQENKPNKVVTPNKAATKTIDINTKLVEGFALLEELKVYFDSNPKNEIIANIRVHLGRQIDFIKEDAMLKQKKIKAVLSKLDREIDAESDSLQKIKETLSKERIARATAEELPAKSAELTAEFNAVKAEFNAQLATMKAELKAITTALEAKETESKLGTQQSLATSVPNTFTPAFSASQSLTADILSRDTIDFLSSNEFICTSRSDLDKYNTSKKFPRYTPLTLSALQINEVACKSLINDGASVNATNEVGNTPLHMLGFFKPNNSGPSIEDAERLTEYFLEKGGDLSIKNKEGKTPRDTAKNKRIAIKLAVGSVRTFPALSS